jgi:tetratricopeptide (TPR) repeat protein
MLSSGFDEGGDTKGPGRDVLIRLTLLLAALVVCLPASAGPQAGPAPVNAPVADPAAAALEGFDEETGLWFPPDAPHEVYLDRSDPKHGLIRDVQKAFETDPALRKAVCALALDPKRAPKVSSIPQGVRQVVTTFHMLCVGMGAAEEDKVMRATSGQVEKRYETQFVSWMNAEAVHRLDRKERGKRLDRLEAGWPTLPDHEARLKSAFEMLGLMPQNETVVYHLLEMSGTLPAISERRFQDFLLRLFERESAEGMPEASLYRMALRTLLFYTDVLPKALELSRKLVGEKALADWRTENRVFLALLQRLEGDASAVRNLASNCTPPERERGDYRKRPAGAFCLDRVCDVASRSIDVQGEKAPKGLVDVLLEAIAAEPTNWQRRVEAIHHIAVLDAARAVDLAEEQLRVPESRVPLDVRLETLAELGDASRRLREFPEALKAYDEYLGMMHYRPGPVPADLWDRLTALPAEDRGFWTNTDRRGWAGLTWALGRKVQTYLDAGDIPKAQTSVESLLAAAFALIDAAEKKASGTWAPDLVQFQGMGSGEGEKLRAFLGQDAQGVASTARNQARHSRLYLRKIGTALLKAGRPDKARRVVAYLIRQPDGEGDLPTALYRLYLESGERGENLKPASSPWARVLSPR